MGERETRVSDAWGTLLVQLLEHRLVILLSEADVATLSRAEAAKVLYDQLRSFMALKSRLVSGQPQSDALRPTHEALLSFTSRLFVAAHQVLLNGLQEEGQTRPTQKRGKGHHRGVSPTKQFLLEWHLVRLKAARERLVMELADLSERNENLFQGLGVPEAVAAEVESARLRISNVWKELPVVVWDSSTAREIGRYIAA